MAKEDRGFASMDRSKQREIASKGGKAAHQKGTAHEWTSEEAREAGRKGGMASHRRKQEQQQHGRRADGGGNTRNRREGDAEPGADDGDRQPAVATGGRHARCQRGACRCRFGTAIISGSRAATGTGRSSNGRTSASGAGYRGSNPCLPATLQSLTLLRAAARQVFSSHPVSPRLAGNGSESLLPAAHIASLVRWLLGRSSGRRAPLGATRLESLSPTASTSLRSFGSPRPNFASLVQLLPSRQPLSYARSLA